MVQQDNGQYALLRIRSGPLAGQAYPLDRANIVIGREKGSNIRPNGYEEVSRRHTRIFWDQGFWIEDLGSRNGTKIGGAPVTGRRRLQADDVIEMGDFSVQFLLPANGVLTPPAQVGAREAAPRKGGLPVPAIAAAVVVVVALGIFGSVSGSGNRGANADSPPQQGGQAHQGGDETPPTEPAAGGTHQPDTPGQPATGPSGEATGDPTPEVVDSVKASTVLIVHQVQGDPGKISMGSGFCVEDGRVVLTNRHVVQDEGTPGASPQPCVLVFDCGTDHQRKVTIPADHILAASPNAAHQVESDLAILVLPDKFAAPLSIGETDALHDLQKLWVIGFPHGITNYSPGHTLPVVSIQEHSVERLQRDPDNHVSVLQIGGSATHGNSGGPVINARGEVVGVLEGGPGEGVSISYAVPSHYIQNMLAAFEEFKRREAGASSTQDENSRPSGE